MASFTRPQDWSVLDVHNWIANVLKFPQHANKFSEGEVDGRSLSLLAAEDFKPDGLDIKLGPRKVILAEIKKLFGTSKLPSPSTSNPLKLASIPHSTQSLPSETVSRLIEQKSATTAAKAIKQSPAKKKWQAADDARLLELARTTTRQWDRIAPVLGRTVCACKQRYTRLTSKKSNSSTANQTVTHSSSDIIQTALVVTPQQKKRKKRKEKKSRSNPVQSQPVASVQKRRHDRSKRRSSGRRWSSVDLKKLQEQHDLYLDPRKGKLSAENWNEIAKIHFPTRTGVALQAQYSGLRKQKNDAIESGSSESTLHRLSATLSRRKRRKKAQTPSIRPGIEGAAKTLSSSESDDSDSDLGSSDSNESGDDDDVVMLGFRQGEARGDVMEEARVAAREKRSGVRQLRKKSRQASMTSINISQHVASGEGTVPTISTLPPPRLEQDSQDAPPDEQAQTLEIVHRHPEEKDGELMMGDTPGGDGQLNLYEPHPNAPQKQQQQSRRTLDQVGSPERRSSNPSGRRRKTTATNATGSASVTTPKRSRGLGATSNRDEDGDIAMDSDEHNAQATSTTAGTSPTRSRSARRRPPTVNKQQCVEFRCDTSLVPTRVFQAVVDLIVAACCDGRCHNGNATEVQNAIQRERSIVDMIVVSDEASQTTAASIIALCRSRNVHAIVRFAANTVSEMCRLGGVSVPRCGCLAISGVDKQAQNWKVISDFISTLPQRQRTAVAAGTETTAPESNPTAVTITAAPAVTPTTAHENTSTSSSGSRWGTAFQAKPAQYHQLYSNANGIPFLRHQPPMHSGQTRFQTTTTGTSPSAVAAAAAVQQQTWFEAAHAAQAQPVHRHVSCGFGASPAGATAFRDHRQTFVSQGTPAQEFGAVNLRRRPNHFPDPRPQKRTRFDPCVTDKTHNARFEGHVPARGYR